MMARRFAKVVLFAAAYATLSASSATAQLIAGRGPDLESVYHVNITNGAVTPLFSLTGNGITFGGGMEGLDVDDAGRTVYFTTGSGTGPVENLYRAHYDDRDFTDPTRIRARFVANLSYLGTALRVSGLAWDSNNNKLYTSYEFGSGPRGIYEINLSTGVMTLVMDFSSPAPVPTLSGLAHRASNGLLYATNNTTGNLFLYSIDLTQPPATARVMVPNSVITSADEGLAIGNDKAYILSTTVGAAIKVFNLSTNAFEASITNNLGGVSHTTGAGAGWGPNALVVPAGSNLGTTLVGSPTNALEYPVGTQISYTVRFRNFGPSNATNVAYSVVLGGTGTATINGGSITSTSGSAAEGPTGTITGSLPTFNSGSLETVTFTVTTTGQGTLNVTSSIPQGGNSDPYLANNTETYSHNLRVYNNELVFTSDTTSPKSFIGGLQLESGTSASERIRKPVSSPRGDYVSVRLDTTGTLQDILYARRDLSNTWSIVLREGVTPIVGGFTAGEPRTGMSLSMLDDGRFAWVGDTDAPTTSDEMTVVFENGAHNIVAREGSLIPALSGVGVGYGATQDSVNLTGDGKFAIRMSSMTGTSSPQNIGIVSDSGQTLLARTAVTIPPGQLSGGTLALSTLTSDTFWMDCTGSQYMFTGNLTGSVPVVIVNGSVLFQPGSTVTGFNGTLASTWNTTAGIIFTQMYANGDWYARGTTTDNTQDFVLKGFGSSYSTVAKRGDPIYTGSSELWSDVDGFGPTFFGFAANRQGDYVLVGRTDISNVSKNAVAVANGTTELLREGDRVDLNNNGLYDDDSFIDRWVVDMQLLTDAGDYYSVVDLRNGVGAFTGKALLRVTNVGSAPLSGADLVVTKSVDDNFLESVGQQATYTVTVCNRGPSDATNVVMTDNLPAGMSFVSATNGAAETSPGSQVVTATTASMPACSCQTYQIIAQATAEGVWNNTASATGSQSDPNPANNSANVNVTVQNQANLSVTKIDDGGAPPGENYTYTITITNNGPATATSVQMTDNLDSRTNFISGTNGAHETSPGSHVVVTAIPSLAPNTSAVVQITVTGTVEALMTNNVSVSSAEVDINPANNSASRDTLVANAADIEVLMSTDAAYALSGDIIYTITVTNHGPSGAPNVMLTGSLSAGQTFVSGSNGAVESPPNSGNFSATFASMPRETSQVVVIHASAATPGTYNCTAQVDPNSTFWPDPDDLNNSATASTRAGNFRLWRALLTKIAGDPTSVAVGAKDPDGSPVVTNYNTMLSLSISPDGTHWALRGTTAQAADRDTVLIMGIGDSGSIYAQESQPPPNAGAGETYDFFSSSTWNAGYSSNNDFAYIARIKGGATGTLQRTYRSIGGVATEVIREGTLLIGCHDQAPNPAGDETLGNSSASAHLLNDGRVGYCVTPIGNCHSNFYPGCFYNDTMFLQSGFTPLGNDVWDSFSTGFFWTTPDGAHWIAIGAKTNGMIGGLNAFSADGAETYLEGGTVGTYVIDDIFAASIAPDGSWVVRGDNLAGDDWAARNGTLVAGTGMSVNGGAETWGVTLSSINGNATGDYVVAGNTSEPNINFDNVLVLNGTDIVAREGDPVDLNQNNRFDDNVYISTFKANYQYVTDDRGYYALVTLRNAEGTNLGDALLRLTPASVVTCLTTLGDANGDGTANGGDVQAMIGCMLGAGPTAHPCKCADFDNDGDIDLNDVSAYVTAVLAAP